MPDAVLIVGGGALQVPLVRAATALGLLPIVTDIDSRAPAFAHAYEYHVISTYDVPGHVALVETLRAWESTTGLRLCGVVTAGADVAVTVATVCEVLETPGIPLEVAERTHNKADVRQALKAVGLDDYQPDWLYRNETCTQRLEVEVGTTVGYPCVIKPLSQRASRGITLVSEPDALAPAIRKAFDYGPAYLIEAQLSGTEHSAEVVFDREGQCVHFHCCDRIFAYGLAPIELGHINPSSLEISKQEQVKTMVLACAKALSVTIGSFKCDVLINDTGPKLLEATARASGGWDSQYTYPRSSGDNLLQRILQVACGMPVQPQPQIFPPVKYVACAAILPKHSGVITALPTVDAGIYWHGRIGDEIGPFQHNGQRLGFVFAEGATAAMAWNEAYQNAREISEKVEIKT